MWGYKSTRSVHWGADYEWCLIGSLLKLSRVRISITHYPAGLITVIILILGVRLRINQTYSYLKDVWFLLTGVYYFLMDGLILAICRLSGLLDDGEGKPSPSTKLDPDKMHASVSLNKWRGFKYKSCCWETWTYVFTTVSLNCSQIASSSSTVPSSVL